MTTPTTDAREREAKRVLNLAAARFGAGASATIADAEDYIAKLDAYRTAVRASLLAACIAKVEALDDVPCPVHPGASQPYINGTEDGSTWACKQILAALREGTDG